MGVRFIPCRYVHTRKLNPLRHLEEEIMDFERFTVSFKDPSHEDRISYQSGNIFASFEGVITREAHDQREAAKRSKTI